MYSEMIGSFIRTGDYPLEANYVFNTELELFDFYSDPVNKTTLHEGLFRVVKLNEDQQTLYWVVKEEDNLVFKKLFSGNISELIQALNTRLELEVLKRLEDISTLWGTDNPQDIPSDLDSIYDLSQAVLNIPLPGISLENAYYDKTTENIVLIFGSETEESKRVEIPAGDLITEWEVDNTNSVIKLTKERVINGPDKLSADIILTNDVNNILRKKDGGLYAKAPEVDLSNCLTAENLDETLRTQSEDKSTTLGTIVSNIDNKVDKEEGKGLSTNDFTNLDKITTKATYAAGILSQYKGITNTSDKVLLDFKNYSTNNNLNLPGSSIAAVIPVASSTNAGIITSSTYDIIDSNKNIIDSLPDTIETQHSDIEYSSERVNILRYIAEKDDNGVYSEPKYHPFHINSATTTSAGVLTAADKAKIDTIDNKADIEDLSNIIGEEIIDDSLLEEIETLTREEIKKDLFIDMWNDACGSCGTYNAETGYFELNGLTDITYEEAIEIYNLSIINLNTGMPRLLIYMRCSSARTLLPFYENNIQRNWLQAFWNCSALEVISTKGQFGFNFSNLTLTFYNCENLKSVLPYLSLENCPSTSGAFYHCYKLEKLDIRNLNSNIDLSDSPLWKYESIKHTIDYRANHLISKAITITVHPDIYAKLIGDTTNLAVAALTSEELAQWMLLVTDAQAKNITFATV